MRTIIDSIAIVVLLGGFGGCSPVIEQMTECTINETITRQDGTQYQVERTC